MENIYVELIKKIQPEQAILAIVVIGSFEILKLYMK